MKTLFETDFIHHYKLKPVSFLVESKSDVYFEIEDVAGGVARYSNPSQKEVIIIDYETFFKSLPPKFRQGKLNCDRILYTTDFCCFLLNEITNTNPKYISDFKQEDGTPREGKRSHAINQLKQTLQLILEVESIKLLIDKNYVVKRCCFFNTQPIAPAEITAVAAFGRISTLNPHGFQMPNSDIELLGFEYWEFSGEQTCLLANQ